MASHISTASGLRIVIDDAARIVIVSIARETDDRIIGRCRKEAWSRGYDLVFEANPVAGRVH